MNRYSTSYASSFRSYDDSQRINGSTSTTNPTTTNHVFGDNITLLSRGTNVWSLGETLSNPYRTSYNVGRSSDGGIYRRWEECEPMDNKHRLKRFNFCNSSLMLDSSANKFSDKSSSNTIIPLSSSSSPISMTGNKKSFTSTFTTHVSDTANLGRNSIFEDKKPDAMTQTNSVYCLSKPRTLRTVAPLFNPPTIWERSNKFFTENLSKPRSQNRTITITPNNVYTNATYLDFNQMFNQIARINNHLYLSSLNAITSARLKQYGITLLISAMIDSPPSHLCHSVANTVHIPVEDMEGANLRIYFDRVVDRIAAENRRGGKALVHCIAGVSRSSTLVLAYLIRHMNMSLADAYQHVRTIRPCIQPNPGFWRQLLDYEEQIRGSRSVQLVQSAIYGNNNVNSIGNYKRQQTFMNSNNSIVNSFYSDIFNRSMSDVLPYTTTTNSNNNKHTGTSNYPLDNEKSYFNCRQLLE